MANIHKRIRIERQNTGKILNVEQAKKIIEFESKTTSPINSKRSGIERSLSKDKLEPSKLLPLSKINKAKREQINLISNKTPSMIDLVPQKLASEKPVLPSALTFEDI